MPDRHKQRVNPQARLAVFRVVKTSKGDNAQRLDTVPGNMGLRGVLMGK